MTTDPNVALNLGLSRSMQQKLKKLPGQQLDRLLNQYGHFAEAAPELSRRQQLQQMIRQKENQRLNYHPVRQTPVVPEQEEVVLTPQELRKKHLNRMKRLKLKFGTVEKVDYYDALTKTANLQPRQSDEMQKYFNLIDLYHHQNPECSEKELHFDENSE